jgi:hypothetical protein
MKALAQLQQQGFLLGRFRRQLRVTAPEIRDLRKRLDCAFGVASVTFFCRASSGFLYVIGPRNLSLKCNKAGSSSLWFRPSLPVSRRSQWQTPSPGIGQPWSIAFKGRFL